MLLKVTLEKEIHIVKSAVANSLAALRTTIPQLFKACPSRFYLSYLDEEGDEITLANDNDYQILLATNQRSAKVYIREKSEEFYDETQQVEIVEEELSEEKKSSEIEALIESEPRIQDQSEIKPMDSSLDQSIEQKLREMMPSLIERIRTEVAEEVMSRSKASEARAPIVKNKPKVVHRHIICDICNKHDIEGVRYKCSVRADFDICEVCEAQFEQPYPLLKIRHPKQAPLKIFTIIDDREDSVEVNGNKVEGPAYQQLIEQGFKIAQEFLGQYQAQPQSERQSTEATKEEVSEVKEEKVEEKPQELKVVEEKSTQPVIIEEEKKAESKPVEQPKMPAIMDRESRMIENANYLAQVMELDFTRCFKFAQKHPELTKEQTLERYLSQ